MFPQKFRMYVMRDYIITPRKDSNGFFIWEDERKIEAAEVLTLFFNQKTKYAGRVHFTSDNKTRNIPREWVIDIVPWTGHHDKNGVEIYQGDIILNHYLDPEGCRGVAFVDWIEKRACFEFISDDYYFEPNFGDFEPEKYGEVVGNIFQNWDDWYG